MLMSPAVGEVPVLLEAQDWAATALGPRAGWPPQLRMAVELMLHSRTAMFLVWGADRTFLYNDAYLPVLGAKHPRALARPMRDSWGEVWDEVSELLRQAFAGASLNYTNHPFAIVRDGVLQQAWFDFSYTPVCLDDGQVGGVLCILTEKTAQVLSERAVKEQAETLQQLFENAPGFMALLQGPDHVFVQANLAYRTLIGDRHPVGRSVREALPELQGQGFFELLDKVYRDAEPFVGRRMPVELRRAPDGTLERHWVDFIYQPVFDKAGSMTGVFVQGNDVTHHVETEVELQVMAARAAGERDRLDVLLDTVPAGIVIVDRGGKVVGANAAMRAQWGENFPHSRTMAEYHVWKGSWADGSARHGQPVEPHEWPIVRVLDGAREARAIVEIVPFDAPLDRRIVLIVAAPVRDARGDITGALAAQTDVTEQIRAEAALRESEAKFKAIANAIPHLVWSNRPDGTHDFYNNTWHEFTGRAGIATTDDWETLVHPDDRAQAAARWAESLATGRPYGIEYRLLHQPSGEFRWCLSRAVPIHDAAGRIVRWLGTVTDVHGQWMLTDELRQASEKKDEFLAMLAHELRNPLAPVKAATDLLKIAGANRQRQAQATAIIDRQVRHMTELIDDLLDVSRVTRGLVELELHPVDLNLVVANAVEQTRPIVEARGHVLHVRRTDGVALVSGDQTRLVQVVTNLLSNAAKYTPQGGAIDVGVAAAGTEARITVRDNGSGIEAGLLPHVFDVFTQGVRTPDRSQGGLGLGLALVKSLVGLHHGSVHAHSDGPGKGSVFEVVLPALQRDGAAQAPDEPAGQSARPHVRRRIVVVDDNADAAETLGHLLESFGHQVRVCLDARTALATAAAFGPDVCILDIGLPDMDGYQLLRRLKAEAPLADVLYIALTGYGQPHDRVLSRAAGFAHHFVKPLDMTLLSAVLAMTA
ncbi:MAG: PAS domain-containing protein [Massilia sp.]